MKKTDEDYENCIKDGNMHLCYVDGEDSDNLLELYFTEIPARFQWGDDWDDAPYEHNAGTPYNDYTTDEMEDDKNHKSFPTKIEKIILETPWSVEVILPCSGTINSRWTVRDINHKLVPWITLKKNDQTIPIYADETIDEVINKFKQFAMKIYKQV